MPEKLFSVSLTGGDVVFRQIARIGTRIGQRLVPFIERLRQCQRGLGGKAETAVGFALQRGQVEQQRRQLRRRLALLFHRAVLAEAFLAQGLGALDIPQAFRLGVLVVQLGEFFVEPAAAVGAGNGGKFRLHFPIVARPEGADALFPLDQDGQRRRLHAADRRLVESAFLGVEGRHGARAIDADQPVCLGAAARGVCQRAHFLVRAQMGETLANGALRHRLQPEAADRLVGLGVLHQIAEDQFALTSRVAGIDEAVYVLALDQACQQLEAVFGLFDRVEREVRRNHRKMGERPFAALDLVLLRYGQLKQMADGRRQHVIVALEVFALLGEAAQRLGDVLGNGGLLCNDQLFAHAVRRRRWTLPSRRGKGGMIRTAPQTGKPGGCALNADNAHHCPKAALPGSVCPLPDAASTAPSAR